MVDFDTCLKPFSVSLRFQVKKYNFDLIEHFTNSESLFAVCSLACLPKDVDYLKNIRDVIYIPHPTSDKASPSIESSPFPIISSVVSIQAEDRHRGRERRKQFNGGAKIIQSEVIELDDEDEDGTFVFHLFYYKKSNMHINFR